MELSKDFPEGYDGLKKQIEELLSRPDPTDWERAAHSLLADAAQTLGETEQALQQSLEFVASMIRAIPFGMDIVDEHGSILYITPSLEMLLTEQAGRAIGKTCWHIYKKDRQQCSDCPLKEPIQIGETKTIISESVLNDRTLEITHTGMMYQGRAAVLEVFHDITERKRTDDELKAARDELERFFRLVPDPVCIASADGYFKKMNQAWEMLLGFSIEELMSQPFVNFIHPDDVESTNAEVARQLNGHGTINFVNRYRTKQGDYRWLEWRATPVVGGASLYAAARDITERKMVEEALRESEEKYRNIVETTSEGIWMAQLDGKTLFVNERMAEMLGYRPEEILGRNGAEFLSLKDRRGVSSRRAEMAKGNSLQSELEFRRKDGGTVWMIANVTPVRDGQGRHIANLSMHTDITERKRMEEALKESEQRYSLLFEKTTIAASLTKLPENVFADVNEAFEKLLGYRKQELLGKTSLEMGIVRPEEYRGTVAAVAQQGYQLDAEKHVYTKDGEKRIILVNVTRLELGGKQYALSTMQDITERKRTEAELNLVHARVVEEKKHLEAVLKVLPIGVAILDEKGGNIQSNDAYEQIWGGPRPQVETVADYSPYKAWWVDSGKQIEPQEWASAQAIEKGEAVIGQLLEIERFDGIHAFILNSGVPIRDEQGRITGSAVALMDVTALRNAENELITARESLRRTNLELQQALAREQYLARTDGLTGTHNNRSFYEFATREFAEAKRYAKPLSIIMFDIDHFKQFNDTYGHQTGDDVLVCVTRLVGNQLRDVDILARYGGEEFVILLPSSDVQEAAVVAERIREAVSAYQIEVDGGKVSVTISMGVAQCLEATRTLNELIRQADRAMYAAKDAGRNSMVVYHEMHGGNG